MVAEWLLALSVLAPAPSLDEAREQNRRLLEARQAEAVQHLGPEAVNPITSMTEREVTIDGRVYVLTVVTTLTLKEQPAPIPVTTTITAVRSESGQVVTMAGGSETVTIEGTLLTREGTALRVQFPGPGRIATLLSGSPTRLVVRLPATTLAFTAPLQVYWYEGGNWVLKAALPAFTLVPQIQPPARPRIKSLHRLQGETITAAVPAGEPLVIRGEGFGNREGRVILAGWPAPVLSWSDAEVRVQGVPWSWVVRDYALDPDPIRQLWYLCCVDLWTADGVRCEVEVS